MWWLQLTSTSSFVQYGIFTGLRLPWALLQFCIAATRWFLVSATIWYLTCWKNMSKHLSKKTQNRLIPGTLSIIWTAARVQFQSLKSCLEFLIPTSSTCTQVSHFFYCNVKIFFWSSTVCTCTWQYLVKYLTQRYSTLIPILPNALTVLPHSLRQCIIVLLVL